MSLMKENLVIVRQWRKKIWYIVDMIGRRNRLNRIRNNIFSLWQNLKEMLSIVIEVISNKTHLYLNFVSVFQLEVLLSNLWLNKSRYMNFQNSTPKNLYFTTSLADKIYRKKPNSLRHIFLFHLLKVCVH